VVHGHLCAAVLTGGLRHRTERLTSAISKFRTSKNLELN